MLTGPAEVKNFWRGLHWRILKILRRVFILTEIVVNQVLQKKRKKNSFQTNNIFIHYSHCVVEIVTEISFFKRPCGYIFQHLLYGFLGWLFQVPRWISKVFWVILVIWQAPESKNRWFLVLEIKMVRQQESKKKNRKSKV